MPSIDAPTTQKIRKYVQECATPGTNWEYNADSICHLIGHGKLISERDIVYADDGSIAKIRGTEVVDGVLLLKEKKKPLKATTVKHEEVNPLIEEIRAKHKTLIL